MLRLATIHDYPALHRIRIAVRQNILTNTDSITLDHYRDMLENRGKGWVYDLDSQPVGFAIADLHDRNIWALFVLPQFEGRGIGRALHDCMVSWMFAQGVPSIWLSTDPNTRAEAFYVKAGWRYTGLTPQGEARYELDAPEPR